MDQIIIEDLRIDGILGIYPHEREQRQAIAVSVVMFTDIAKAADSENITDAVDYEQVCNLITAHVQQSASFLVERLVTDIARLVLKAQPMVQQIRVKVTKPDAIAEATAVGAIIERSREDFGL